MLLNTMETIKFSSLVYALAITSVTGKNVNRSIRYYFMSTIKVIHNL